MIRRLAKFIQLARLLSGPAEHLQPEQIQQMGLLAVKISQMYAVRPDFLSPETCARLQTLFEQVPPISWEEVHSLWSAGATEEALSQVTDLSETCLASGSLGQVHRARLGEIPVVVKVLKPSAISQFEKDVSAARTLIQIALFFYPPLARLADPAGTLESVVSLTRAEMNLRNELDGTQELQRLATASGPDFPEMFPALTSRSVLVAAELPGQSVRELLDEGTFPYTSLLDLFRLHGHHVFHLGQFHGDLHPGNIFFHQGRFAFLDNSTVERVDRAFSRGLLKMLILLAKGQVREAALQLEKLAREPLPDNRVYLTAFQNLYSDFDGHGSLTRQMMHTVQLAVKSGLEFPSGTFPIIKTLMYLDGIALQCAPDKHLLDDVLLLAEDGLNDS